MLLREFVAKSVTDIIEGVADAQQRLGESHPTARVNPDQEMGQLPSWAIQNLKFDVAVTTEAPGVSQGSGQISVLGVSIGGSVERSGGTTSTSRLAFEVPILLPLGRRADHNVRNRT